MKELRRSRVSVAAIQETKWFGMDVWEAEGYTLLHSGRKLPEGEGTSMRNEGVGIALDERATAAWRDAGEIWEAVNSSIVTARLKVVIVGQRRADGSREKKNIYMSVISVYAPTAKAPPAIAHKFLDDLQDVVDRVPLTDVLMLMGDFNARVGSGNNNDLWWGVRGRHGVGRFNEAGEGFLEFCARNELTIMNTQFEKKQHHLATWKHPATKQSHMIDYIVMRHLCCTDVQVMRGANCWSDHSMVRARVRVQFPRRRKNPSNVPPVAVHSLEREQHRTAYQQKPEEYLSDQPYTPDETTQYN